MSVLGVASAIRGLVKAVFDALHAFSQSRYGLFEGFKSALSVRREHRDVWAADASVVRCHAVTPCCCRRLLRCTRRGIVYWDECALGGSGGSTACSNGVVAETLTCLFRGVLSASHEDAAGISLGRE